MAPEVYNCPICGWSIIEGLGDQAWQGQFRGLYSSPEEGIILTGVGRYTPEHRGTYIAPPDPAARWSDPGYGSPMDDQFGVMAQGYRNGRRGFVLHESCWLLLKHAHRPAPVPHERLFEVLSSVPLAMTKKDTMDWGHDYGGLVFHQGETSYLPWEYLRFSTYGCGGGWFGTPYIVNPLATFASELLFAEPPQAPPSRNILPPSEASSPGHDPFGRIPQELRFAIVTYLSIPDFLSLRLASRSFWSVFDTQQLWASHFRGLDSDHSWLFEAERDLDSPGGFQRHDWRWLYLRTAGSRMEEWMKNRKRVWRLILPVMDMAGLTWSDLPAVLPAPWTAPSIPWAPAGSGGSSHDELSLVASGNRWGRSHRWDITPLQMACTELKKTRLAIPADGIARIDASMARLGRHVYVAGLALTTTAGESVTLGYTKGRAERFLQLKGETLTGFNLAIGLRGIQALQCVSSSGDGEHLSPWLGYPENAPKTRRLSAVANGGMMVLEFGFDGLKIISIAATQQPTPSQPKGSAPSSDNFHATALWYPEIPPPSVNLNTDFMVAPELFTQGYRPLFWTCFGGPGGMYLANLVKIRFILLLGRIDFSFNRPDVPVECQSFGQASDWEHSGAERVDFAIDGPGGEKIQRVKIRQELALDDLEGWRGRGGRVISLKIRTNRGRKCEVTSPAKFGKHKIVKKEITAKKISASGGEAITGFYGAQYRYLGIEYTALGDITEPAR